MATKNVNSFLATGFIDLNTSDSLLGVVNGDLKRLNAGSISMLNLTARTGTFSNGSVRVTSSGIDLNTGCNIYGANNYQRITGDFTTTTAPSTRLSFNLESGKVYQMDQYFRFTASTLN